jgi:hypothetical protein
MSSTANGSRSPNINYAGVALPLNGQTYYWMIRFWDTNGTAGAWSTPTFFTMLNVSPPASCRLTENSSTQMIIIWIDRDTNETNYAVHRSTDGGAYSSLTTSLIPNTQTYTDNAITAGHTYTYRVRALFSSDFSDWCTTATMTINTTGDTKLNGIKIY